MPKEPEIKARLKAQAIETPSWGYADSGKRFATFGQPSAAHSLEEKLDDAAQVHKCTGMCPSVALHIPWDRTDDWEKTRKRGGELGLRLGAVNPNLFPNPVAAFRASGYADRKAAERGFRYGRARASGYQD
jgi:L-rhamnose isomerase/sugar isomerase